MKTEDNLYSVVIVVVGIVVVVVVAVVVVVGRVRTLTSMPFPPASCLLSRLLLPILCQSSQIKVRKTEQHEQRCETLQLTPSLHKMF